MLALILHVVSCFLKISLIFFSFQNSTVPYIVEFSPDHLLSGKILQAVGLQEWERERMKITD